MHYGSASTTIGCAETFPAPVSDMAMNGGLVPYEVIDPLPPNPNIGQWLDDMDGLTYLQRRTVLRKMHAKKTLTMPRFLYRFHSLRRTPDRKPNDPIFVPDTTERLEIPIVHSLLKLSSPADFNDPFDMGAMFDLSGTPIEKRYRLRTMFERQNPSGTLKEREDFVEKMIAIPENELRSRLELSYNNARKAFGVICFAGGDDPARNVLMWSHYAAEHSGVCLQFDPAQDLRTFHLALSVKYCESYPVLDWFKNFPRSVGDSLLRKHPRWDYEWEHRISIPDEAGKHLRFAPAALRGVILGCRADAAVEAAIRDLLGKREGVHLPKIALYRAGPHRSRYDLVIRTLSN